MIIARDKLGRVVASSGQPRVVIDIEKAITLYNGGLSIFNQEKEVTQPYDYCTSSIQG